MWRTKQGSRTHGAAAAHILHIFRTDLSEFFHPYPTRIPFIWIKIKSADRAPHPISPPPHIQRLANESKRSVCFRPVCQFNIHILFDDIINGRSIDNTISISKGGKALTNTDILPALWVVFVPSKAETRLKSYVKTFLLVILILTRLYWESFLWQFQMIHNCWKRM